MYAWCTRKTASGSMEFISSKRGCYPTASCRNEPIAPSAIRIECLSRSLKSRIFKSIASCLLRYASENVRSALLIHEAGDGAHEVVLGENLKTRVAHFDKYRGILVAQDVRHPFDRRTSGD